MLLELYWSFFQVGIFSIGGGLAALPLIQNQVVDIKGWLTLTEFIDLITIAEMTPGPIAINSATFVGTRIAGLPGAIVATIGCITPSVIIVSILAWVYSRYKNLRIIQGVLAGLRPAIVALIASAGFAIMKIAFWGEHEVSLDFGVVNWISVVIFGVAVLVLRRFKFNPVFVMLGCGVVGGVVYLIG